MTHAARIAVIGAAGWAGSRHVQAFHALGASVVALVDPIPQVRTLARAVGAEVLDSPARLDADDVDLVVVSLPSSSQPGVSADLLQRSLRVLVEKPIGSSSANAAVLGELENIDDALMVGYTLITTRSRRRWRVGSLPQTSSVSAFARRRESSRSIRGELHLTKAG
jgi:predicted dehydrogenase